MIRQSFAWWSFTAGREVEPATLLREAASAGAQGVEMLPEPLWPVARDAGLSLVTLTGHTLERGCFCRPERRPTVQGVAYVHLDGDDRRERDQAAADGPAKVT